MLPFLAPLALKLLPVKRFLKSIPRPVWIGLAVLLIVGGLIWYHRDAVSDARKAGYAQGVKDEGDRIAKKAASIKAKADAASAKISKALKDQNDEANRAIGRAADDIRLHGPGKAACPGAAGVPSGAGRSIPGGKTNAPVDSMPGGEGVSLIGLPFADTVGAAERCDLYRAEVLTWREWYRQQSAAWAKIR